MTPVETLRAQAQAVLDLPDDEWDETDGMCPNCVTPWKCNGPHESQGLPPRSAAFQRFEEACDPQTILTLLDDLDAARARIAALDEHNRPSQRGGRGAVRLAYSLSEAAALLGVSPATVRRHLRT